VELRHLRYFIRAAELLHFTRAAESLFISQPTLSVHIHQLEEELGTELFARVGRSVRLTEAGELLLMRARKAVEELETAGIEIDAITGLLRGNLRIASLPLYGRRFLPPCIAAFNSQHPNVHIHARSGSSEDIEAAIVAGTVDLGFSILPVEQAEVLVKELFSDELVVIVSRTHPLAEKKVLVSDDLQSVPMALPSQKVSAARLLGRFFEEHKIQPEFAVEHDDGQGLIELTKLGKFITCLPRRAIPNDPEIRLLPLPEPGLKVAFGALWTTLGAAANAFLEVATVEVSKHCVCSAANSSAKR
jgi:LysR family cyn operon transcriptional activator